MDDGHQKTYNGETPIWLEAYGAGDDDIVLLEGGEEIKSEEAGVAISTPPSIHRETPKNSCPTSTIRPHSSRG